MSHRRTQHGFTLVELMLAMAFISALLLAIALLTVQIGTTYTRGMTVKDVNQIGRSVSDDLQRSIAAAGSDFKLADDYVTTTAGGRLCVNQFSYLWNYAEAIEEKNADVITYDGSTEQIHLAKVSDASGIYCERSDDGSLIQKKVRSADVTKTVELLKSGEKSLSIHQLELKLPSSLSTDTQTGERLYYLSFIVGTADINALNDDQTLCLGPESDGSDLAYCAVNQFSLAIRTGNGVN